MEFRERFRGFLPVVVDLETGGFDVERHPLLEVGMRLLDWQDDQLVLGEGGAWSILPFAGSEVDPASLKVTGINLDDPKRVACDERIALTEFFKQVRAHMKHYSCHRAILVAHNSAFDMSFLKAACERCGLKRNPFHPFSTLDTAGLSAVAYGHTVLSEACQRAGLEFDNRQAHSAAYDADRTADLFCAIVNAWPYKPIMPATELAQQDISDGLS